MNALNKKIKSRNRFKTCLMLTLFCQRCSVLRCFQAERQQWSKDFCKIRQTKLAQNDRVWLFTFNFYDLADSCLKANQFIDLTSRKKMTDYWKNNIAERYVAHLDIPGYVILPPEKYPTQLEILPPRGPPEKYSIQTLFKL